MTGNVLIVDDNPNNLSVLESILTAAGYEVRAAINGEVALKAIAVRPPDLMLIDIMMPGMDGFEVCRRIMSNPKTEQIPVLFISALSDADDKIKAFEAGGVDYITKPFYEQEVLARVKTHLKLRVTQKELLEKNLELRSEIKARESAEKSLAENNLKLSQIIEGIPIPTFVIDNNHVITHWNKAIESLTDLKAKDMIGTKDQWEFFYAEQKATMADLVLDNRSEQEITNHYDAILAGHKNGAKKSALISGAYEAEGFFPHCGAKGIWFSLTAAPLTDKSGAIIGVIETTQDVSRQKLIEERLRESEHRYKEESVTDSLTELYNSRYFFKHLKYEISRAKRYGNNLSLLMVDIDDFKKYNDTYGHQEGDKALKALAGVLKESVRDSDTSCRYGGEEFTVLLPETPGENAKVVAERLRSNFAKKALTPQNGVEVHMTISIGISEYANAEDADRFLKRADNAMYEAKNNG
jgi:diguanylate cyclase (GGDEF)-like protein/PAS domain S-box-containing protein